MLSHLLSVGQQLPQPPAAVITGGGEDQFLWMKVNAADGKLVGSEGNGVFPFLKCPLSQRRVPPAADGKLRVLWMSGYGAFGW